MKFLIVLGVALSVACGQFVGFSGSSQGLRQNQFKKPSYPPPPGPSVVSKPYRSGGSERDANVLRSGNEINPDGSYNNFYETDNGIAAQEEGTPKQFPGNPPVAPVVARGSFSWTSPEGQVIAITYVADENGYQPSGSAIPTPPPIPEAILRSIEYNLRNAKN